MGFGILFIGYFLTMNIRIKGMDIPPDFIGYILMIFACNKLSEYSRFFRRSSNLLAVMAALSAVLTGMQLYGYFFAEVTSTVIDVLTIAQLILSIAMHYCLLSALIEISSDVGRSMIAKKCRRNIYITLFLLLVQIVSALPVFQFEGQTYYIVSLIIANAAILLNSIQIFSCYMWICYEGDEDMDPENTIDPIAKMMNKTRKEEEEYNEEKKRRKAEKKKNGRKK